MGTMAMYIDSDFIIADLWGHAALIRNNLTIYLSDTDFHSLFNQEGYDRFEYSMPARTRRESYDAHARNQG